MSVHNDPKKWMIFVRESDGDHFLWNGEGCVRVSTISQYSRFAEERKWHHNYGELSDNECDLLNTIMNSKKRVFAIKDHGRYQVVARGEFNVL